MYSLRLTCTVEAAEQIAAEIWDYEPLALSENEWGERVTLLAGFDSAKLRNELLQRFAPYDPEWEQDETNWQEETERAWPPREVGRQLFLAPPWCRDETPAGRVRLVHNPGLASGTGEHPCTQLALEALERLAQPDRRVLDVGTGSGILAIAARLLGTACAVALDTDLQSLETARENFQLNALTPLLVGGSIDCIDGGVADITLANISGTVLLSMLDDLLRVTRPGGWLVLTGFPESEATTFDRIFPQAETLACNEWRCLLISLSWSA